MALMTDKDAIRELLGGNIPSSADALLDKLAAAAHAFVVSFIGYDPIAADYTDVKDGNDNYQIAVDVPNLNSVASLRIDGTDIPPAPDATSYGFVFNKDGIVSIRGARFTRGFSNVAISFNAGLQNYPADLSMAVTEIAAAKYRTRETLGIQSKTLANETITFTDKDMPNSARSAINDYVRTYLT